MGIGNGERAWRCPSIAEEKRACARRRVKDLPDESASGDPSEDPAPTAEESPAAPRLGADRGAGMVTRHEEFSGGRSYPFQRPAVAKPPPSAAREQRQLPPKITVDDLR